MELKLRKLNNIFGSTRIIDMAVLLLEGFDIYGPTGFAGNNLAPLLQANGWGSGGINFSPNLHPGLSATGQSFSITASGLGNLSYNFANAATICGGARFQKTSSTVTGGIELRDTNTFGSVVPQVAVTYDAGSPGTISVKTGAANNRTVIPSSTALFYPNVPYYL